MNPTIADAVAFIKSQTEIDMDEDKLVLLIKRCITRHGFDYVTNASGDITGLYIGEWEKPYTVFRVYLLLGRGEMRTLMRRFKKQFPLLEEVVTGRHKHSVGEARATYSKEVIEKKYSPLTFKI